MIDGWRISVLYSENCNPHPVNCYASHKDAVCQTLLFNYLGAFSFLQVISIKFKLK